MLSTQATHSLATFSYHEYFTHIELFTMDHKTSLGVFTGEITQGSDDIRFSITLLSSEIVDLTHESSPGSLSSGEYIMEAKTVGLATPITANVHIRSSKTALGADGIMIEAFTYELKTQETLRDNSKSINGASALLYPVDEFFVTDHSEYTTKQSGNILQSHQVDKLSLTINQLILDFTLDKSVSCLKIAISKAKDASVVIDENTLMNAIDSVRFMLGKNVTPLISEITKDGILTQSIKTVTKGKVKNVNPPVLDIENNFECIKLYERHLDYLSNNDNKLNLIERSVVDSAGASLEAQCLTIGVASESVVSEILDDYIIIDEGYFSNEKIKSLKEHTLGWFPDTEDIDDDVEAAAKQRISGLIGQLHQTQVKQKLIAISDELNNSDEIVKSWGELRNKAAHGTLFIGEDDIQEYFDHYNNSLSLFYQLVFLTIGYTGVYTDYSQAGYLRARFTGNMKRGTEEGDE